MAMYWPFAVRADGVHVGVVGSGQWRRIDQGQDLQAAVGTPIVAIAAGTITFAHDLNGFGDPYPVLTFDTPVAGFPACYYGHTHPGVAEGTHVQAGQVIAHAAQVPGGNAAGLPGWLELGWWKGGPSGGSGEGWTQWGQSMHDHLLSAPVAPVFGTVLPAINPPLPGGYVDWHVTSCFPAGAWLLREDGAIFTLGAAQYPGGLNTNPNFSGRTAAHFASCTDAETAAHKVAAVIATSGERYTIP